MPIRKLVGLPSLTVIVLGLVALACSTDSDPAVQPTECPSAFGAATSAQLPASCPTVPAGVDATPAIEISNAIAVRPGDDLQQIVESQPEGTTFAIKAGVHRLQSVQPRDGDSFIGEPGAILNGAKLVTDFTREGEFWVAAPDLDSQLLVHGECNDGEDGCKYPQDVFVDDVMLRQVTVLTALGPGEWFLDPEQQRIYLFDDPTNHKVELSVVQNAFYGTASNVTIRELVIEKYATPAQQGAIQAVDLSDDSLADNWVVEQNEIRLNHGAGIKLGTRMQVLRNYIHHNGQIGISASGSEETLVEENEIAYNNVAGFSWGWEAGGAKFVNTTDLIVRGNYVHHNRGPGLWTDFENRNTLYEDNFVEGNENMGIFHETSYDATIRGNSVSGNGFAFDEWLWGAGILVAASSNVEIYENTVSDNADGIAGIQQDRGAGQDGPFEVMNLYVHDNVIAMTSGETGLVQDIGDDSVFQEKGNRFESNTYQLGSAEKYFHWLNRPRTSQEWVDFGNDTEGRWL